MSLTNRRVVLFVLIFGGLVVTGGCAYYNTFYNIKKDFRAAEKQTQRAQQASPQPGQQRPSGSAGIPIQQYQGILQSCSKLLEFYPNSRWIDDALMVMGICYYRTDEFARAERKFTELASIFPDSRHSEEAIIWRAKSLLAQNKSEAAENLLLAAEDRLKNPESVAGVSRTLAQIYSERKQYEAAIEQIEKIGGISYDRNDKATDYLTLGRAYSQLLRSAEAVEALERCLNLTRSADEAFSARALLADIAAKQGEYERARNYLHPLETDRRFIGREGDIQLEAARVEAEAGDPAVAILLMERFCSTSGPGETKARAYYLQGMVAMDKLGDLELARAKFDSVPGAGAPKPLQDSAQYEARRLETGLVALQKIPVLRDSLALLTEEIAAMPIETPEKTEELELESEPSKGDVAPVIPDTVPTAPDTMIRVDSLKIGSLDSLAIQVDSTIARTVSLNDTAGSGSPTVPPQPPREGRSRAQILADSLITALGRQDSVAKQVNISVPDTLGNAPDTVSIAEASHKEPTRAPEVSIRTQREQVRSAIARRLVEAHLDAAAFNETVLQHPDSALAHLVAAAQVKDESEGHWRAAAQLGKKYLDSDSTHERGIEILTDVSQSESAPVAVRNAARIALGLPKIQGSKTEQELEFERVEREFINGAPFEDAAAGYQHVVAMDSTTDAGVRSLHALAYLLEFKLARFPEALDIHRSIIRLFPDSSFTQASKTKLIDPDTSSIFLMSEEALQSQLIPASEILKAEADSSGWPPEESTLRGRRFE